MVQLPTFAVQAQLKAHGWLGLASIVLGQTLTYVHWRPLSDYWFGLVWFGYSLTVDALTYRLDGYSLLMNRRRDLLLMLPVSAVGWWGLGESPWLVAFFASCRTWGAVGSVVDRLSVSVCLACLSIRSRQSRVNLVGG